MTSILEKHNMTPLFPRKTEDERFPRSVEPASRLAAQVARKDAQQGVFANIADGFQETGIAAANDIIQDEATPLGMELAGTDNPEGVSPLHNIAAVGLSLVGMRAGEADYNKETEYDALTDGIPYEFHDEIMENDNRDAAYRARERVRSDLARGQRMTQQEGGALAMIAGGIVDADLPLTFMSGGAYGASKLARRTLRAAKRAGLSPATAGRVAGVVGGANAGLQSGALVGATTAYMRETAGWEDVVEMAFSAALLGGGAGAVMGKDRVAIQAAQDEFHANVATDHPGARDALDIEALHDPALDAGRAEREAEALAETDPASTAPLGASTVGAAQITQPVVPTGLVDPLIPITPASDAWHRHTRDALEQSGWSAQKRADDAEWFAKVATSKLGAFSVQDFTTLYTSKAYTANYLAGTIFESASGLGRGRATSAVLMEMYTKRIQSHIAREVPSALTSFARERGETWKGTGFGYTAEAKATFYRETMLEMNDRALGRTPTTPRSRHIVRAADAYEKAGAEGLSIGRGREGQTPLDGFENIPDRRGYTPYSWKGATIHALEQSNRITRKNLISGLAQAYRTAGMNVGKDADAVAKAVITRALSREAGVDTSLVSLLSGDGRAWLESSLESSGMSKLERDALMERLSGKQGEAGKEGFAKMRNEIDMNTAIRTEDGSDLRIVDLLDNDMHTQWQRYGRRLAGSSALARHGITNRAKRTEFITALQAEQRALGEVPVEADRIHAMLSHFNGGPVAGFAVGQTNEGVGQLLATTKRLVNIALLEKLGRSQLAESGATIAQNGFATWWARGPAAIFDKELKAGNAALLDEVAFITGRIGDDHRHFASWLDLDDVSSRDAASWLQRASTLTSNAQWMQGYTSLFNQVRTFQQTTAALGMGDKVMRIIKKSMDDGVPIDPKVLKRMQADLGFGYPDDLNTIERLIENGTIVFKTTKRGNVFVDKLNMDQWDVDTADNFGASMTRNINQLVQKSLAGEQDAWIHTHVGSILTHLKTFPLQAISKQVLRNGRHLDTQSVATVLYGMATAGVAVAVFDAIDGNDRSPEELASAAFNYSNMTGFIPMVVDPVLTMLGMEDSRFNQYGPYTDLTPPMFKVLNDQRRIPGAIFDTLTGNADYYDKQALKAIPYAGTFFFSRAFQ